MSLPELVVYQDAQFGGDEWRTNLNYSWVGSDWNDSISSVVIVSGTWQFFDNADYQGAKSKPVGPGYYSWVEDPDGINMTNDTISSFKCISWDPV